MLGSGIARIGSWSRADKSVGVGGAKGAAGEWVQLALLTLQRDLAVYPDRICTRRGLAVKLSAHGNGHCVTALCTRKQPCDQGGDGSNPEGGDD